MPRARSLTPEKQTQLCSLVAQGVAVACAADQVGVTLRTVEREVLRDEDFEHDLRLAEQAAPVDPLKLMQQAARSHWRAAAWMLERTDDRYAKRKPNYCTADQLQTALDAVIAAAVNAADLNQQAAICQQAQAAAAIALRRHFPAVADSTRESTAASTELAPPSPEPITRTRANNPLDQGPWASSHGPASRPSLPSGAVESSVHSSVSPLPSRAPGVTIDLAPTAAEFDEILNRVFRDSSLLEFDLSPNIDIAPTHRTAQAPRNVA